MKRLLTLLTCAGMAAIITATALPDRVYADEMTGEISLSEEAGLDTASSGLLTENGSDMITKIDPPDRTEYSFEYKVILDELLEELPKTAKVWFGDEERTVDITWKCEEDYDLKLDEYHFVPVARGEVFADDAKLPQITVTFEKEREKPPLMKIDQGKENSVNYDIAYSESSDDANAAAQLPDVYNNFEAGKLPPVRNQDPYGTCWAFATLTGMEADLIHDKKASTNIDLSELHMAYFHTNRYKDPKNSRKDYAYPRKNDPDVYLNQGAWPINGAYLLSDHIGAVRESLVPYESASTFRPDDSYLTSKDVYQLEKAFF